MINVKKTVMQHSLATAALQLPDTSFMPVNYPFSFYADKRSTGNKKQLYF